MLGEKRGVCRGVEAGVKNAKSNEKGLYKLNIQKLPLVPLIIRGPGVKGLQVLMTWAHVAGTSLYPERQAPPYTYACMSECERVSLH